MLVRVPAFLLQGVAATLLPGLTRLQVGASTAAFNATLARATGLMLAAGAVIVAAVAAAGQEGMELLFGDAYAVERTDLILLASGVAWYLGAVTISQALLARGCVGRAATCWLAVAFAYVGLFAVSDGASLHRASVALAGATAIGFVLLAAVVVLRREQPVPN
jgi:O-antigen/teichoic acid export membrane protein